MKRSLRNQLSVIFSGIFIAIILVCILCNVFLLKEFFLLSKYKNLKSAYERLNAVNYQEMQETSFIISMRKFCEKNDISAVVLDKDGEVMFFSGNALSMKTQLYNYYLSPAREGDAVLKQYDTYVLRNAIDEESQWRYIEAIGALDSGDYFLVRTSAEGIENSVRLSNVFLVIITLIGIIAGIITISIATRKITKPIQELAQISEKMTNLDFEAKYKGDASNEIDALGNNINHLSESLEKTIGELKSANANLVKDLENREKAEESRREFVANASHELKTPIALIQGYAEGLKEGISDDPESRAYYCDVIMDEAGKMNELVKKLMSLNELEMGQNTLSIERFDIKELIDNQLQTMSLLAQNKGITLKYEEGSEFVWSDVFKTEEVFRNYLSNALNHCAGENKEVVVSYEKKEDVLRINVFNTGENIPEESLGRIWDKFYKVDKARTREYGGSGVGLSIVKATMELLGMEYGCENKENGVMFYFCLPQK